MVARLLHISVFILLLMPLTTVNALNFTASVDTKKLQVGASLLLTLKADEQAYNKNPDLSPLKQDFEILSNQQTSQVRLINGEITSETKWQLTLLPKSEGYVVIPPIKYGKTKTKAITINVAKRSRAATGKKKTQLIFLDATTDKKEVYVQEQVIFYLRVYQRSQLANASLSKPEVENVVIENLGEPRSYTEKYNGQPYTVTEYRFAIYPQKSGKLVIPPSKLTGAIASNVQRFSFNPFGNAGKQIRRQSQAITINVKAIPASYPKNVPWIPAHKLSLSEQWSPNNPQYKVGEPTTRTITLRATGIAASLLPPLPQPGGKDIKVYPDQPRYGSTQGPDGVVSERIESYAVIPSKGGTVQLPAINVHWWNTQSNKLEIAKIPAKNINVTGTQRIHQTDATVSAPPPTLNSANFAPPATPITALPENSTWVWIAAAATTLWILTVIALVWALRRKKPSTITENVALESPFSSQKLKENYQHFAKACNNKEPRHTEKYLALWAAQMLQDRSIRSSAAILQHIDDKHLRTAVNDLQAVLYREKPIDEWDNQLLLDACGSIEKKAQAPQQSNALADLHPSLS
ncbi:MAG: hypothetical protein COA99_04990 [Moraxellaceae bacterium]|nr:MAG: hypothetical protein COA99_04990 [Moraxellaceae bacterium]